MRVSNNVGKSLGRLVSGLATLALVSGAFAQMQNGIVNQPGGKPLQGVPKPKLMGPAFMENRGQWNEEALFLSRAPGQDFWVTRSGYLVNAQETVQQQVLPGERKPLSASRGHVVRVTFAGANQAVSSIVAGTERSKFDFVHVLSPQNTVRGVRAHKEATISGMYPGIDARYYTENGLPRYDLIVRPGADANLIRMDVEGADNLSVTEDGTLVMGTSVRDIKQAGLVAYQVINGQRVQVPAKFVANGKDSFGFRLGKYDSTKQLVIDPVVFGTYLGGDTGSDQTKAVVTDAANRIYIAGTTGSVDFPILAGPWGPNLATPTDGFVAAIDGDAYDQVYGAFMVGGGDNDNAQFLKVDQYGNLWCAGETNSLNFPSTAGNRPTLIGFFVRFQSNPLTILDPITTPVSGVIGSTATDTDLTGFGIAPRTTPTGSVDLIFAGNTTGAVVGITDPTPAAMNGFVVRQSLNNTTSTLSAVTGSWIGSSTADTITGLAIGGDGGAYVTGVVGTSQVNALLSPTSTIFATTSPTIPNGTVLRGIDYFVRKYAANGSLVYSGVFGSSGDEDPALLTPTGAAVLNPELGQTFPAIAVDTLGSAYIAGISGGFNFPKTRDSFIETFAAGTISLTKINPSGNQFLYSTSLGTSLALPTGVGVDQRGNAYVAGVASWELTNPFAPAPTAPGSIRLTPVAPAVPGQETAVDATYDGGDRTFPPPLGALVSGQEAFITVVNNTGTGLNFSSYLGGNLDDASSGVYLDQTQSAWVYGYSCLINPAWLTANAFKTATVPVGPPFGNDQDGLVIKYRFGLPVLQALLLSANEIPGGLGAFVDGQVQLRAPAPVGGTTITLRVTNPAVGRFTSETGPSSIRVTIPQGQQFANFQVFSRRVLQPTFTDVRAEFDSDLLVTRLNVRPWLNSLQLSSPSVRGGNPASGVVTLFAPAPASGVVVNLTTDTPSLITFPSPSITVPAGQQSVTFDIDTNGVNATTVTQISVNVEGVGQTVPLTLLPATILDVSFSPTVINGGETSIGTIRLDGEAVDGTRVLLSQTGLYSSVPSWVDFSNGETQKTFQLTPPALTVGDQTVTITGSLTGNTAVGTIVVEANDISVMNLSATNVLGGTVIDGSITLARPAAASGFRVPLHNNNPTAGSLSPTVVTVPPGATSVNFQVLTNGVAVTQAMTVSCDKNGYARNKRGIVVRALEFDVVFNPNPVKGGNTAIATLTLRNGEVAPAGGIQLLLSSSAPSVANVPGTVNIAAGQSSVTFNVTTGVPADDTNVTITAGTASGIQRPTNLLVKGIAVLSLAISPNSVVGGINSVGTITIDKPAPTGGFVINLSSNKPTVANTSTTVTIPSGSTSATFPVVTFPVSSVQVATITATRGTFVQTANITVNPATAQSITMNPASVRGGNSSTATVTLSSPAPAGGLTLTVVSNRPEFVSHPATVVVPAGQSSVSFNISTTQVTLTVGVTFTATTPGGSSVSSTLFITPNTGG